MTNTKKAVIELSNELDELDELDELFG